MILTDLAGDPLAPDILDWKQLDRETRQGSDFPEATRQALIRVLDGEAPWTLRLHVVRLVGRVKWSSADRRRVLDYLFEQADGANKFVTAWAVDSLSILALDSDAEVQGRVAEVIHRGLESPSAAVRVRCRHALARLRAEG